MALQPQTQDWAHGARMQALRERERGRAGPADHIPGDEVLDSWARCVGAGLDAAQRLPVQVVEMAELERRREQADVIRRLAGAEMEILSQQIAGSNFLLAFADRDCVILDLVQDNRFVMSNEAGILPGSVWSEALCGTNGLGTACVTGRCVAVTGHDHFFHALGRISCTAAPVHDCSGEVVGILDASSYFESRQQHTQALVHMAAAHIENRLMLHEMRPHWVLAVHPRPEYLGTLSVGLIAFDQEGRLRTVNARGRHMLQGLPWSVGCAFEDLFDEPFERVWPRLARGGELRLRDHLGSGLVVRCLNRVARPAPPQRQAGLPDGLALPPRREQATDGHPSEADAAVRAAYALASRAARLRLPVLIQGETGTGKELLARHLHQASGRRGAFVAVNCGGMPQDLFEAELFGHAGGAFTGARRNGSPGLIASSDGGTLLLDELGEMPLGLQATLLRFLDDQTVRPLGAAQGRRVDVQIVAATNADLQAAVAARAFRADLLYRLNTVCVTLPPLREREDLVACAEALLQELDPDARLQADAAAVLLAHPWPGNFRELRAVLACALLQSGARLLKGSQLREAIKLREGATPRDEPSMLRQITRERVRHEFERRERSVSATARALGISRTTVYRHNR